MNLFTRRMVYVSTSFEKAAHMRAKIQSGSLKCTMTCKNLNRATRGQFLGTGRKDLFEYRLYVHKKDVEMAVVLMNQPGF